MRLLLVVALVACQNSAPSPRPSEGSADPWAVAPKPPDTPVTRQARAEAALGRVATIQPTVAKLRELAFTREVPTRYQTTPEFQAFVHREIAKELPGEKSEALSAAYAHVGLFAKPIDIAAVEEQAMTTQAGAYYDPSAKAFFLVMVPDSELMLDTISAHELTHALQDQHFDLTAYLPATGKLDQDAATARRFVAEGDATFTMLLYALHSLIGDKISPQILDTIRGQVASLASQDLDALKAQAKSQASAFGMVDGDIKKSIDAMDDIPPAVLVPLLDAYMKGALVALTAYDHGGWPAVDALYRTPPTSTEQVLHPAEKLFPRPEPPRKVTLPASRDPELAGDVIGELLWKVYFELWKVPDAAAAAAGWGGDRMSVTRGKDGKLAARIATVWDTAADAREFAAAYQASLAARFPGGARPDGTHPRVRVVGAKVYIVDGGDPAALDALVRGAKLE
jgi:hypothetical protein